MSDSLTIPRYELQLIDPKSGQISREWYKYLALLGNAIGSQTVSDDTQVSDATDDAASEALGLHALKVAKDAESLFFYGADDRKQPDDLSLLGWWP